MDTTSKIPQLTLTNRCIYYDFFTSQGRSLDANSGLMIKGIEPDLPFLQALETLIG